MSPFCPCIPCQVAEPVEFSSGAAADIDQEAAGADNDDDDQEVSAGGAQQVRVGLSWLGFPRCPLFTSQREPVMDNLPQPSSVKFSAKASYDLAKGQACIVAWRYSLASGLCRNLVTIGFLGLAINAAPEHFCKLSVEGAQACIGVSALGWTHMSVVVLCVFVWPMERALVGWLRCGRPKRGPIGNR